MMREFWRWIIKATWLRTPGRLFMSGITTKFRLKGMFSPQEAHPANPAPSPIAPTSLVSIPHDTNGWLKRVFRLGLPRGEAGFHRAKDGRLKRVFSASIMVSIRFGKIEQTCYNMPNCIDMQKCTLTTWFCSQTRRYAPSKNVANLANLANREKQLGESWANVPWH